jgi:succinate dehydrogenase/fumarate reductase flavoprotein subunit
LKSLAAGAAGVAAFGAAGCTPSGSDTSNSPNAIETNEPDQTASTWKTEPTPVADTEITQTYESEVLIVGHGHAGINACRYLASIGKKVTLIEQMDEETYVVNGNEGAVPNAKILLEQFDMPRIDPIDYFNNWQLITANNSNPELVMKYAQNSGEAADVYFDSLTQEDIDSIFIGFKDTPKATPPEMGMGHNDHILAGVAPFKNWRASMGFYGSCNQTQIQGYNRESAKRDGAEFFFSTTAQYLEKDASGKVIGVIATNQDGAYVRFKASAVILATGGFGSNPDMVAELLSDIAETLVEGEALGSTMDGRFGDGIKMAYWAGAKLQAPPIETMSYRGGSSPGWPQGIWLNSEGKRYCNEFWGSAENTSNRVSLMQRQRLYAIYPANLYDIMQYINPSHATTKPTNSFMDCLQQAMATSLTSDEAASAENPDFMIRINLYGADTLDGLLKKMGMTDEAAVSAAKQTIEVYNAYCAAGADSGFGREPSLMWPIADGPFYGQAIDLAVNPSGLTTLGGLNTDGEQRVLDTAYTPIPGLYASGNLVGHRYGRDYFTPITGVSLGMAWTLGRECGKSVAADLNAGRI